MSKVKFYDNLPEMECLAGDTLPTFNISVEADSLDDCRMQIIVSKKYSPDTYVICKECTAAENGFQVQLTSSDTFRLTEGCYEVHFRLIDSEGLSHRKLAGSLYVRIVPKGE